MSTKERISLNKFIAVLIILAAGVFSAPTICSAYVNEKKDVMAADNLSNSRLMLVSAKSSISKDYVPKDLVDIAKLVKSSKSSLLLDKEAAEHYILLEKAAKGEGIKDLIAVSGYRTYDYQEQLYKTKLKETSKKFSQEAAAREASKIVAPPGMSEHQTGLALDVSSTKIGGQLTEAFTDTKAYEWLVDNSFKYGFIIRYPEDKQEITGIIFEPWHIRYVGAAAAKEIHENKICLEEYLKVSDVKEKEGNKNIFKMVGDWISETFGRD